MKFLIWISLVGIGGFAQAEMICSEEGGDRVLQVDSAMRSFQFLNFSFSDQMSAHCGDVTGIAYEHPYQLIFLSCTESEEAVEALMTVEFGENGTENYLMLFPVESEERDFHGTCRPRVRK